MQLPEARKVEIEIFGRKAFLQERTAEERYQMEDAVAQEEIPDYVIALTAITSALFCNIKPGFWNWRKNRLFRFRNLRKNLKNTQIEFLTEEIGKLEYGEEYEELKKKAQAAVASREIPLEG